MVLFVAVIIEILRMHHAIKPFLCSTRFLFLAVFIEPPQSSFFLDTTGPEFSFLGILKFLTGQTTLSTVLGKITASFLKFIYIQ